MNTYDSHVEQVPVLPQPTETNAATTAKTNGSVMDTNYDAIGVIEVLDFSDPIAANSLVLLGKHDQDRLVRTIGERMREARELCNLSQSEAARRFGYSNPSKLSKIEAASDTRSVPLWAIYAAAQVYEVSVDFLFGFTNDFEVGTPRGTQAWMLDAWQKMRERDLSTLDRVHVEVTTVSTTTAALVSAVRGVGDALSAFRTRNGEFDDMPASSPLVGRLARLEAIARDAEVKLRKLRLVPREAA